MNADIKTISSQLKSDILKLMEGMIAFHKKYPKFSCPKPSDNFQISRELLAKGEFNLAVCGKVKNGKSSLINALIGKPLLPVCSDVATSRVFKISHSEKEQFYVVYGNGDRKEITQKELSIYGSQAVINKSGEVEIEKSIAYIQVYTPIDFLPEGVSLIDTPGIGSTYPQHTSITKQYIKMADAALFVMNPTPLESIEVDFLKEVVNVTPGILFVTTKIDQNGNDSVEDSIKRNYQIIDKSVGASLPFGISMLKMSSSLLLEAATSDDQMTSDFNYEISGYEDVKSAIVNVVFSILGYYRSGLAYNSCVDHYKDVKNALMLRHETATSALTRYEQLKAEYEDAEMQFKELAKTKRDAAFEKMETILKAMEFDFNTIFSPKGSISTKYNEEIDLLTEDELTTYSENLSEKIVSDIQNQWEELTSLVQKRIGDVLNEFNEECLMSIPEGMISVSTSDIEDPTVQDVQLRDRIGKMRHEMFLGSAMTGALSTVVGGAYFFFPALITPALPILAPVMVILGVGTVLWGAISGNQKAKQESLQKNKAQLSKYVSDTISYCRKQIVEVSLADKKYQSLYQGFLEAVREQFKNTVSDIVNKYADELAEMAKTVEESKQDPNIIMAIQQLLTEWNKNKESINMIHDKLEAVKPV